MPGEAEKLSKTFQIKEEYEGFISNLENLKSEGTVTPEVYSSLKSEYEQKLKASLSEVDRIKDDIKSSLAENLQEKEALTDDLRKLEIALGAPVPVPVVEPPQLLGTGAAHEVAGRHLPGSGDRL